MSNPNDPSDPSTWDTDFAAKMQASTATYQAQQTVKKNASKLTAMTNAAFVADPAFATQAAALQTLADGLDRSEMLGVMAQNASTVMSHLISEFSSQYGQLKAQAAAAQPPS